MGNYWAVTKGPEGSESWVSFIDVHNDPGSIEYYAASNVLRFLKFVLSAELGERGWPRSCEYVLELDPELQSASAASLSEAHDRGQRPDRRGTAPQWPRASRALRVDD